jgi:hypothetical protein
MPRGSGSPRRPRADAGTRRETPGSRSAEAPAEREPVVLQEAIVTEPSSRPAQPAGTEAEDSTTTAPRFRIFIVDSGWDSPAHKVLQENFGLIRELQREDPIYVLGRDRSIEYLRHHEERIGHDPIIAVHDLAAMDDTGTTDFHGFRLRLGLLRTHQQALLALQNFARFLRMHRQSVDLEAEIRRNLRREGFAGAIEIILQHEAREIGG